METATITMDEQEAQAKLESMQSVDPRRLTTDDLALMKGYKALAKGAALLDLVLTMRIGGINETGLPKLAIARADALSVKFNSSSDGGGRFEDNLCRGYHMTTRVVQIPEGTWGEEDRQRMRKGDWRNRNQAAFLPIIPIEHRPDCSLGNFHLLWEAEWKPVAPVDPILLRHLMGRLYVVIAQWDLTELEQAVLNERIRKQQ